MAANKREKACLDTRRNEESLLSLLLVREGNATS